MNLRVACLLLAAPVCLAQNPAPEAPAPNHPTQLPDISARQRKAAEAAYLSGARQLDRNNPAAAEKDFAHALQLNPSNHDYALALAVAREHQVTHLVQQASQQRLLGHTALADTLIAQANVLDPQNPIASQHLDTTPLHLVTADPHPVIPQLAGAIQLTPRSITSSFHLRADAQPLLRQIAESYGIHCIFDPSVNAQSIRLDLDNASYAQAMSIALMMTHVFAIPLDPVTVLLVKDTVDNRQQFQPQLVETIEIPNQGPTEINDLGNLIRNVFDVKQANVEPTLGNIVVRAPQDILHAINLTLSDMLDGGSELMIDVKLYEVDTNRSRNVGVQLPQSAGAYDVPALADSSIAANQSAINQAIASGILVLNGNPIQNLVKEALFLAAAGLINTSQLTNTLGFFGGGITTTGVYLGSGAVANFALNTSETHTLDDIQLRVLDRQDAIFRTGTRYPITTSVYTSSVPTLPSSLAGATINGVSVSSLLSQASNSAVSIPQIQYEDLGLTLKATPIIQKTGGLITLKLDMKIEALAGSAINNIPILANRALTSTITVADGATALLISNLSRSESAAVSGTPGLNELPGFQAATNNDAQLDTSHLVILLTPHIVRKRPSNVASPRIAVAPPAPGSLIE